MLQVTKRRDMSTGIHIQRITGSHRVDILKRGQNMKIRRRRKRAPAGNSAAEFRPHEPTAGLPLPPLYQHSEKNETESLGSELIRRRQRSLDTAQESRPKVGTPRDAVRRFILLSRSPSVARIDRPRAAKHPKEGFPSGIMASCPLPGRAYPPPKPPPARAPLPSPHPPLRPSPPKHGVTAHPHDPGESTHYRSRGWDQLPTRRHQHPHKRSSREEHPAGGGGRRARARATVAPGRSGESLPSACLQHRQRSRKRQNEREEAITGFHHRPHLARGAMTRRINSTAVPRRSQASHT